MRNPEMYDISVSLREGMPVWPGDGGFVRHLTHRLADGDLSNCSRLELGAHTGTHIDTPLHFLNGRETLDDYPVDRFRLAAEVIDATGCPTVTADHVASASDHDAQAIVFKTDNSMRDIYADGFVTDYVGLTHQAAEACVAREYQMVGVDYLSVDAYEAVDEHASHLALLDAGIIPLEGLDLSTVPPGRYTLIALPLKLAGSEASPVRAVLIGV